MMSYFQKKIKMIFDNNLRVNIDQMQVGLSEVTCLWVGLKDEKLIPIYTQKEAIQKIKVH